MRRSTFLTGERIGTIAVVLSLVFVGIEVRDGNREARAATIQATLSTEMDMMGRFLEHAAVWDKVLSGESLSDGEELRTGLVLYNMLMTDSENWFLQYNAGYLDSQVWESRLASLPPVVGLPIYEIWRTTPGGINHAAEFLALIEDVRADSSL